MSARHSQVICLALGAFLLLVIGCGGGEAEQRSFVSNKIEAVPTNVSGQGTTSGIGAGAAFSAPGSTTGGAGSPTPTTTPTLTPAPGK